MGITVEPAWATEQDSQKQQQQIIFGPTTH